MWRIVTKTLLFVGEGDPIMSVLGSRLRPEMPASIAPGAGGRKFRAYNKATGAMLWETELPAGTTGAPMTYMFEASSTSWSPSGAGNRAARDLSF